LAGGFCGVFSAGCGKVGPDGLAGRLGLFGCGSGLRLVAATAFTGTDPIEPEWAVQDAGR
jgi:hypothetical protein